MDDVGDELADIATDAVAELVENDGGNLTSVLTFTSLESRVHNNTLVECSTYDDESSNNFTIIMAGTH